MLLFLFTINCSVISYSLITINQLYLIFEHTFLKAVCTMHSSGSPNASQRVTDDKTVDTPRYF